MKLSKDYTQDVEGRYKYVVSLVLIFFLVILGRLFFLQVMRGGEYRLFSLENSIKIRRLPAVRGNFYDWKNQLLVDSRPAFDLVVVPQFIEDKELLASSLSRLISFSKEEIKAILDKYKRQPRYEPVIIMKDIPQELAVKIRANKLPWIDEETGIDLTGVEIRPKFNRDFKEGDLAPHVFGYLHEISSKELSQLDEKYPGKYFPHDIVGATGLEKTWDVFLKGEDGSQEMIVNAIGRVVHQPLFDKRLRRIEAKSGADLYLTLDGRLQKKALELMDGRIGAIVALDPRDGAVRVLVSTPAYDLNRLQGEKRKSYWQQIVLAPENYLFNRAIQGAYPPGSTYKIVTATALLSEKEMGPESRISCGGGMQYGGRLFRCWNKHGHGSVNLEEALKGSCDVYFYRAGLMLGVDRLAKYAKLFGLGQKTGIDLPNEVSGLIPTAEWKLRARGAPWSSGETPSIAIGQGYDLLTPLQVALMGAVVANGGKQITPHLVDAVVSKEGERLYQWDHTQIKEIGLDPDVIERVKNGMIRVVEGGTARRLMQYKLKIAGKTGTAQVVALDKESKGDHAWFVGFAPHDTPELVIAALVEHGGGGSAVAAPIVGELFKEYFAQEKEF